MKNLSIGNSILVGVVIGVAVFVLILLIHYGLDINLLPIRENNYG